MDGNDEALTFRVDSTSDFDGLGSHEDTTSESSEEPTRRLATFSLSMSTMSDIDCDCDDRSSSILDDWDYTKDVVDLAAAEMMPTRRELRLSRILGISDDERIAKRLMQGELFTEHERGKFDNRFLGQASNRSAVEDVNPASSEFDYVDSATIRRCISLKSSKTPPGTPHRKKAVRFADVLGLDLATTKQILNHDDPPNVPDSATRGLTITDDKLFEHYFDMSKPPEFYAPPAPPVRHLCACFAQPGFSPDFLRRVEERCVSLEHCTVEDASLTVAGTVRVANICFEKQVCVRYTSNGWMTYNDELAVYVPGSNDGVSDQFSFVIHLPDYFDFSSRMEFSVMYVAGSETYWDSNFGSNYRIECHVEEAPVLVRRNVATHQLSKEDESGSRPFY
jgi:protein phosphatase 1 regulatory subunit 3A/B/C/D/E